LPIQEEVLRANAFLLHSQGCGKLSHGGVRSRSAAINSVQIQFFKSMLEDSLGSK
jgi:hypothetical protein